MKKLDGKQIVIPAVSLFLICLVVTGLLAGTNLLTKEAIAQQSIQKAESSRKVVLPQGENFEERQSGEVTYYVGMDASGNPVGYVFTTESKGYGGALQVMTGIAGDDTVQGVVLLSQNETPGLGANAAREDFRNQYQQAVPQNGFEVVKSAPNDGQIEAMTGATISSNAVTDAVNLAVKAYQAVKGESNGGAGK